MASGYSSIHPIMAKNLKNIGVASEKITQGWGTTVIASAGFHNPEGWVTDNYGKHRYSSCVDLSASLGFTSELKSRLVAAGFCPFFRDWAGNKHIHCVYVGLSTILDGPKSQIIDYYHGLNGLVGHAPLTGELAPTAAEKKMVQAAFLAMDGHNTVNVIYDGRTINCYAFMGRFPGQPAEITRCELRPFVEFFGAKIIGNNKLSYKGQILDYSGCRPVVEGDFTRVDLRPIASLISKNISNFAFVNGVGTATLVEA